MIDGFIEDFCTIEVKFLIKIVFIILIYMSKNQPELKHKNKTYVHSVQMFIYLYK